MIYVYWKKEKKQKDDKKRDGEFYFKAYFIRKSLKLFLLTKLYFIMQDKDN